MDVSKLLKRHKARREQDHQKHQQDLKKLTEKHQAEVKQLQEDYKSKLPQAIAFHRNGIISYLLVRSFNLAGSHG